MVGLPIEAASIVRTTAGDWWLLHEAGVVPDKMMVDLKAALGGKPDYSGEVASRFDRLIFLLLRFLKLRIDGQGASYPYLRRVENKVAPGESELQNDLWVFLTGTEYPEAEKTDISAGRVDIYIPSADLGLSSR